MFIPNCDIRPVEDDSVILKLEYSVLGGKFTVGHKFKVINVSSNGLILIDDDGNIIYNVPFKNVSLNVSLEKATEYAVR